MAYVDHMNHRDYLGFYSSYQEAFNISLNKRKELRGEYVRQTNTQWE